MVAISAPAKILLTGANGYLATWIVKKYLEAGYSVRGTVRSLSKGAFLKDKFAHYGDRFELVVVEDITKDGAFDEAVKGVDAIAHTASPFHYKSTNPDGTPDFSPNIHPVWCSIQVKISSFLPYGELHRS
jgi:nucleoside-diphosphate-sugar epimerase